MKKQIKLSIAALSLVLSCGVGLFSVTHSSNTTHKLNAATDYSSFFEPLGKELCYVTVSSTGITAEPAVLTESKITNPAYVYIIQSVDLSTSVNRFPEITYTAEQTVPPVFYVVVNNIYSRSGDRAPIFQIGNENRSTTLDINFYIDGLNILSSHNWNTLVCRNNGHAKVTFSTTSAGTLQLEDRYSSNSVADDRGYLDIGFDSNININEFRLDGISYSNLTADNLMTAENQLFTSKKASISLTRSPEMRNPNVNCLYSTDVCLDGTPHSYSSRPISYNWTKASTATETDPYTDCTASATCSVCGHKLTEKPIQITSDKVDATCTIPGRINQTATFNQLPSNSKMINLPTLGHDISPYWTFDEDSHWRTCANNDEERLEEGEHIFENTTYSWSSDNAKCTKRTTCSVCGYAKSELSNSSAITIQEASCTNPGIVKYTATFNDGEVEEKTVTTSPTGHSFDTIWHTDSISHWHACTREGCTVKENLEAHTYGDPSYIWNENNTVCTMTRTCNVCGHVQIEEGLVSSAQYSEATCEDAGILRYSAEFASGLTTYKDTAYSEPLGHSFSDAWSFDGNNHWHDCTRLGCSEKDSVGGHTFGSPIFTWSDDGSTCVMSRSCTVCGYEDQEEGSIFAEADSSPTCDDNGSTKYTAFFSKIEESDSKIVFDIDPLGHIYSEEWSKDETNHWHECTRDGCQSKTGVAPHNYEEPSFAWSSDGSSCLMSRICKDCGYEETEEGSITSQSNINPTCELQGSTIYTAHFTKIGKTDSKEIFDINKLGHEFSEEWSKDETNHWHVCVHEGCTETNEIGEHTYGAPIYTWADDGSSCSMVRTCTVCGYEDTENASISSAKNIDSTCEEHGSNIYTASFNKVDNVTKEIFDINPLGHDFSRTWSTNETSHWHDCLHDGCETKDSLGNHTYGDPVFTWAPDGSSCSMVRTCTVCGYEDTENASVTSAQTTDPTCTEFGATTYTARFTKIENIETKEVFDVPELGHAFSEVWSSDGTNHWHDCTHEDCDEKANISAHTYGQPTFTWASDGSSCVMTRECSVCGHVDTENGVITSSQNALSDCVNKGSTVYTARFTKVGNVETKEVFDVPELGHAFSDVWSFDESNHWHDCTRENCHEKDSFSGHTYEEPTFIWSNDGHSCRMTRQCSVCGYTQSDTAVVTSAQNVAPTCESLGSTIYTATFTKINETPTKEVYDLPALGHTYSEEYSYDDNAHWHDCEHEGCTSIEGREEHTFDIYEKYDENQHKVSCFCGSTHLEDHVWDEGKITVKPTTSSEGVRTFTCIYCGETKTETIPAIYIDPEEGMSGDVVDDIAEAITDIIPTEGKTEEEIQQIEEAMKKITEAIKGGETADEVTQEKREQAEQNMADISSTVNEEMNVITNALENAQAELDALLNDPNASEEEKAAAQAVVNEIIEKKETVEVVTEQAVLVASKQLESEEITGPVDSAIPEDVGLDMGSIVNDFMQEQIDILLGKTGETPTKSAKKTRESQPIETTTSGGIDFSITKEEYAKVNDFVDNSVGHMTDAALQLRSCSGEKTVTQVKNYITLVRTSSFRDFDKEAADAEFVENAYNAILLNMQQQVLAILEQNKPDSTNQEQLNQYNEEVAAVSDIEEFEIIVTEVLRRNYVALTGQEVELDTFFEDIYMPIFRAWALNDEESLIEIFPDGNVITLEKLTTATIEETTKTANDFVVNQKLSGKEIGALCGILGIAVVLIGGSIITTNIIRKRKEGGAN